MEIERKFLISKENLPENLGSYPHHKLEQDTYPLHRWFVSAKRMITTISPINLRDL